MAGNSLSKVFLGVDIGQKKMGLAQFDYPESPWPRALKTLPCRGLKQAVLLLEQEIAILRPQVVVVGLPLLESGGPSRMSQRIRELLAPLQQALPQLEWHFQDEFMSTEEAMEWMRSRPEYGFQARPQLKDEVAALIILMRHLKERSDVDLKDFSP